MVLEDFFTLTEMKDGLTTLARVEELVAVMQTSDCIMKSAGDAARQWSTVATVLAATGNKHCLSHFIQSDGLQFLNQWLQVAQKCNNDTSDSFVEESISALLGALEKIPINNERLTATGIRETIMDLLAHKSFEVQEKARSLCDSWNEVEDEDPICQVISETRAHLDDDGDGNGDDDPKSSNDMEITIGDGCSKSPIHDASPIKETAEGTVLEHLEAAKGSDDSQLEIIKDVKIYTSNQDASPASLNQADVNGYQGDTNSLGGSLMSNSCQEISTITEKSSLCPLEATTSGGTCNSLIPRERNIDDKPSDVSELKDANVDNRSFEDDKGAEIEMTTKEKNPCKYSEKKICATYSKLDDQLDAPSPCPANDQSSLTENGGLHDVDAKEQDSHTWKNTSVGLVEDHSVMELEMKSGTVDCQMPNYLSTTESKPAVQHDKSGAGANFLHDLTNTGCMSRKPEDPEASILRKEDFGKERACKSVLKVSKGKDSVIARFKPTMDDAEEKCSEMELDYGLDDALEVARRVAKEVEREVVDYREPLCSSSAEKNMEGETTQPSSPDSVKGEHYESIIEKPIEDNMLMEQDLCNGGLSPNAKRLRISKDADAEPEYQKNYLESPKSTEVGQEIDNNNDKSICSFDLNEDVCSDEVECSVTVNQPISVSAPVPVVAASKGAPTLRTIPLHFQGELGWRGSAATSAFRPPSPRRTPDPEKTSLVDGSSNGPKQRQNLIDLNLAEGDDDSVLDVASSAKYVPVSSGLHSGDSSVEVSSKRAEKLNLDLNCVGEENEEDAFTFSSSDWKAKGQLSNHQNGKPGPSPASSSSSRQAHTRDFDLNDNPSFDAYGSHDHQFNSDKAPCQTKAYNSFKLDGTVISILGSKIDLGQKEFVNQKDVDSTNAASLARASDGSGAQPSLSFAPMPFPTFGYNSQTVGPAMPFHPQFYGAQGSGSYMMDSRGPPFAPQIPSAISTSFARPFFVNVMDVPSASNGAGSSHSGHDLNSGVTWAAPDGRGMGTGTGTFGQQFGHGSGSLMEEQMKSSGAGVSLKRKEPDFAWELNMVGPGALWR